MLEWLLVKVDELLALSMRVAVAMESIAASLKHMHSAGGLQGQINSYNEVFNEIQGDFALLPERLG